MPRTRGLSPRWQRSPTKEWANARWASSRSCTSGFTRWIGSAMTCMSHQVRAQKLLLRDPVDPARISRHPKRAISPILALSAAGCANLVRLASHVPTDDQISDTAMRACDEPVGARLFDILALRVSL